MKIVVKLFAAARQFAGSPEVVCELPADATVADLRVALAAAHPALAPLLPHALFAINAEYATDATRIPEDSEIACIPPVSGG